LPNPYASSNRWRHAESKAFARYEKTRGAAGSGAPVARDADARGAGVSDLADFLNKSRIDPSEIPADRRPTTPRFKPVVRGAADARAATAAVTGEDGEVHREGVHAAKDGGDGPPPDGKEVVCGPLLNYRRMEGAQWFGSVLVVTKGGGRTQPIVPMLKLRRADEADGAAGRKTDDIQGLCLYSDTRNTFWRFDLVVQMEATQTKWEYEVPDLRLASKTKPRVNNFFVPALDESMRIMFHSCNGFSVGTDEAAWSGPALWNDVIRLHQERPFHVM
jgi:hypothetical protein